MDAKTPKKTARAKWPAEKVETWPLARIKPYPRNPRTHPDSQIELLARLMAEHGVDHPIVVDEAGVILKGHGRLLAAKRAGFDSFPVVVHRGLPASEKRVIRIADNQSSLLSSWDEDMLRLEMVDLTSLGENDLSLLGFSDDQVEVMLNGWSSDIDVRERFGENTEGIKNKIVITVGQADIEAARALVSAALKGAKFAYELT